VDDLVKLWNDGIFMARTYQHPRGRSVRAALALLVCDMPAARLLGGFAHFSSNADPCSMCKTSDLNNLNSQSFLPRTNEEHRRGARAWLAAQSEEERDILFRRNGVRYSDLLRLDYWDPVRNTVVDPMHGFYLRILQRHCRQIWGMNVELVDCEGLWEIKLPTEEGKATAKEIFDHGTASNLRNLKADSLRYLALQEGLDYRRNKKALADSLLHHRSSSVTASSNNKSSANQEFNAAHQAFLDGQPKTHFKKLSTETIQKLANLYGVHAFTPAGAPSRAKQTLIDALFKWRDLIHNIVRQLSFSIRFIDNHTFPIPQRFESGITSENGQLLNKAATRRSGVLGKDTLAAIREDMEKLRTPSWMAAAPNHPGEASQGKFTADQWRTFCTVNLPITLIRLWGSLPHEERRYEMLVNFMHLITSIRLADMRVMTEERIQTFERHYRAYLTGIIGFEMKDRLGGLYPHTRVTPYQHMMLHFGDLLRLFGPVHSWRCFAFERFNYILQTTKTNSRFG
ncbi:hypothetical protein F5877DRAFT_28412, partial [Lentinula edodes]